MFDAVRSAWIPINSILPALVIALSAIDFVLGIEELRVPRRRIHGVEVRLVTVITAAYVAFAHGANDRSNAIGPMATVYELLNSTPGEFGKVDSTC